MDVRMEDFFDPTGPYEMVIADHLVGDFNTGFVGFKATPRALAFLKRVSAAQPKCKAWFVGEQGGFNQVIYEMIQEHLCFDDGHILPASHDACDKELLQKCINACGDMLELFPCYEAFRAKLPPDVWTYGHRTLFPWMLFHKYNGSDPDSPLVSFNRFWQHDPKFHPLSRPSDFISHAKTHQDPYVFLVAQMEKITQTRKMARDGGETFCQAMTRMDTWCNKTHGDKCDRDNVVIS